MITVGGNLGSHFIGARFGQGTFSDTVLIPTGKSSPAFTSVASGGDITSLRFFYDYHIALIDPYTTWGDYSLTLPVGIGMLINEVKAKGSQDNFGFDADIGIGLRHYSRSWFSWYANAIYHFDLISTGGLGDGGSGAITNTRGEEVSGGAGGLEVGVGLNILFETDYKARD